MAAGAPSSSSTASASRAFASFAAIRPKRSSRSRCSTKRSRSGSGFRPTSESSTSSSSPDFQQLTGEVEYEQPAAGGYSRTEQELTWLRIGEKGRLNLDVEFEDRSLLTEDERDVTPLGAPGESAFRSLVSDTAGFQLEGNYARAVIETGISFNINGTVGRNVSSSLFGLATDGTSVLETRGAVDNYAAALSLNQPLGAWTTTFTSDLGLTDSETEIDRNSGNGFDIANSRVYSAVNKLTVNGFPLTLPGGELSTTLDIGLDWTRIESDDTRSDTGELAFTRRSASVGLNVAAPLMRAGPVGDVTLVATGGFEDLSDFGGLANWSLGVNWSPTEALNLSATRIWREVAPGLTELGNPLIETFNVPTFDFRTGETVLATQINGGNPDLLAETQSDWKFAANWKLPFWNDARISADYGINRSRDVTSSPSFSSAFEEAFPDRVTRGGAGELLAVDRRPLTLFETRSRILSIGLNSSGSIGKAPPRPERPEGAGRPGGGAGGPPARGGPPAGGGFDPSRMEAIRKVFCETPEGETPDLSQIPEMFRARLLDENGEPDPEKIAAARARFCGEEAEQRGERFAAMREAVCADPPKLDELPEEMRNRLLSEEGEVDPEKLKALRERMCSASGEGQQGQQSGRRGGGGFRMFGGNPNDTRPRYFISLNHSFTLENEVLLAEGGPLFDQLDGFVLDGAVADQSTRLEGGVFWQGYGLRLSGRYIGESLVRGGDFPGSSDIVFGDLTTFDLRLFANLGEVFEKEEGWLDGLRVSLLFDNVFDARREVVDENGDVPAAFEPLRLDPTGRYLGIDIRKAF